MFSKITIFIFIFCNINLFAQKIKINVSEKINIGKFKDGHENYLFAGPRFICTDRTNNIYVADKNMSKIRVFSIKGKFIKSFGRKGQGPGEMQEISSMSVDHNDNLIIADRMNQRYTKFINMGEDIESYTFTERIDPLQIHSLDSDSYLVYFLKRINYKLKQENDLMLHIYDKKFSTINTSFVQAGEILDFKQPFLKSRSGSRELKLTVITKNKIVISPGFYNGILYVYQKKYNEWIMSTLNGIKPEKGSYKILNRITYSKRKKPRGTMSVSGLNYNYLVQRLNISKGIFKLYDDKIVHFVLTLNDNNNYTLSTEIFNQDDKFLGYTLLTEEQKSIFQHGRILWKDNDDRFYLYAYDIEDDIPYISVVTVTIQID